MVLRRISACSIGKITENLSNLCTTVCLGYDYVCENTNVFISTPEERESFLSKLSGDGWERILATMEYEADFVYIQELVPSEFYVRNIQETIKFYGCDEIVPLAIKATIDGTEYYLYMDVARYGNKWYNLHPGGSTYIYNIHIHPYAGGIVPVKWLEEEAAK